MRWEDGKEEGRQRMLEGKRDGVEKGRKTEEEEWNGRRGDGEDRQC